MSEVEEFERVRIGNVRDATIAGPAVIDLIHLLAELIENALGFSPPESTVEIDGRSLGQGGYQFAVIDHGVGMTDVELLAANHRLRGLDELEGMPTRYLGQYVVAKLAAKTGALVRLQPSTGGRGVTALVILPISALVGERDRDAVAQPLPGSRAAREQGPVPFAPGAAVASALDAPMPAIGDDTFADLRAFGDAEPSTVRQYRTEHLRSTPSPRSPTTQRRHRRSRRPSPICSPRPSRWCPSRSRRWRSSRSRPIRPARRSRTPPRTPSRTPPPRHGCRCRSRTIRRQRPLPRHRCPTSRRGWRSATTVRRTSTRGRTSWLTTS